MNRVLGRRGTVALAGVLSLVLVGALQQPVQAAPRPPKPYGGPTAQKTTKVPVRPVGSRFTGAVRPQVQATTIRPVSWPAAGQFTVSLGQPGWKAAGSLPVRVAPAAAHATGKAPAASGVPVSTVRVRVRDQQVAASLGLTGVLMEVDRADGTAGAGPVQVAVDSTRFADAVGGGWGSRLHLVSLPACALTTPSVPACRRPVDVPGSQVGTDHVARGTVSLVPSSSIGSGAASAGASGTASTVTASAVVAIVAGASGSSGSYTASALNQSSAWDVGQQSGTFTWSYPLRVPPGINGPTPQLGISYDSGSVDGRTAATNAQPSWVGEGFDLGAGFVERRYVSCQEDMTGGNNTTKTGDLCWRNDNAVLTLAGHSSELIKDSTTGAWKLRNDDGSRMELLTGAQGSPDNDGEYWKLTTSDGTQYFFGKTKRYAGDPLTSNATWTVPVAGNQPGEPCHASTFSASFCDQAWRWNVDYVVDPHGNTMSYLYTNERNRYGKQAATTVADYDRGGYLTEIDYGGRAGSEGSTPPVKVVFNTAERCIPDASFDCAESKLVATDSAAAAHWPDVPADQLCSTSATSCPSNGSPTFFTRKRLTQITTQVLGAANTYSVVDQWDLSQDFYSPGDASAGGLELKGIAHTGQYGATNALPAVTFAYEMYRNRVTGLTDGPTMYKPRLTLITNETGGQLSPHYDTTSSALCSSSTLPSSPSSNTTRCYPSYWTPEGATDPTLTWFYKYVVDQVAEKDAVAGAVDTVTSINYVGGAAWRYDDNELTPAKYRTWSDWRGYGTVEIRKGDNSTPQTLQRTIFLRGMDGNRAADGSTVSVSVTDTKGGTTVDADRANGTALDTTVWNGSALVSTTISKPTISAATATSGSKTATLLGPGTTTTYTALAGGGERQSRTTVSIDGTYGTTTQVDDEGDVSTPDDDRCIRYDYVRNSTAWIVSTVSHEQTVAVKCATTPASSDVISDTRYLYDGGAYGAAPTAGKITETQVLDAAGTTNYVTKAKATYDNWGRVHTSTDALGYTTTTDYVQQAVTGQTYTGGVVKVTTTDPKGFAASSDVSPAWGTPLTETDINSKVTSLSYDGLGRLVAVWLPTRPQANYRGSPSMMFGYSITKTAPSVVTSQEILNTSVDPATYITRYEIYDGMLRPRQVQSPEAGTDGGRVITETVYDSRGLPIQQNGPYYASGAPSATLVQMTDVQKSVWHALTYDQAGRVTLDQFMVAGAEKYRTSTTYGGNSVTVDPPDGVQPTTTWTDARDRVTAIWRYKGNSADASLGYDTTSYTYYPNDKLKQIAAASGAKWDYTYDLRGRLTKADDPDKGATAMTYDDNDRLVTTQDARGTTIWNGYDELGRPTETRLNNSTGTLLTARTYDTVAGAKGKPATATRYVNGNAYSTAITAYDDAYRPTSGATTIPSSEGTLAGTYTTSNTYSGNGSLTLATLPAVPGMAAETLAMTYDTRTGAPAAVSSSAVGSIVGAVIRSPFGEGLIYGMGQANAPAIWLGQAFEEGTRRLIAQTAQRQNMNGAYDVNLTYGYDKGGNVTSIVDAPNASGTSSETQCFQYDYSARLTEAWTPTSDCTSNPTVAGLGGPSAYWHSYTYDVMGNRKTETIHTIYGDNSRAYTYPAVSGTGKGQPDTLTKLVTTPPAGTATTVDYGYDNAGNTKIETTSGGTTGSQSFTWDDQGHLASANTNGTGSSYVYDADGERLIRHEGTKTTLYLDDTEVQLDSSTGSLTSTRYYTFDGKTVAMRQSTGGGLRVVMEDRQGSAIWSVDTKTATDVQRRRFTPFGADRAGFTPTVWTGERGFVDGTKDSATGLTHLGAREYDPSIGRFLSVDPVMTPTEPASLNPYVYSQDNPVTLSDPSGLEPGSWCNTPACTQHDQDMRTGKAKPCAMTCYDNTPYDQTAAGQKAQRDAAQRQLNAAQQRSVEIKKRLIEAAKKLGKILMDELGITAGLDCFTKGDVGACAETAVNVLLAAVAGFAAKIIGKYLVRWVKASRLVKTLYKLGTDIVDSIKGLFKVEKEVAEAERALAGAADAAKTAHEVPGDLVLARGGTNTADRFASGSGVVTNADGTLSGVSVNSGRTVEEAAQGIPHKQIGVTTAEDVRRAGGTVTPDPLPDNPGHCLMAGCTADMFSELFTPTIKNPGL